MNNVIQFDTSNLYFQILLGTYSKEGQSDDEDDDECSDTRCTWLLLYVSVLFFQY